MRAGNQGLIFVFLDGDFDLIWKRIQARKKHFMKAEMLKSQFDIIEIPSNALKVNINQPVGATVEEILKSLALEHWIDPGHLRE